MKPKKDSTTSEMDESNVDPLQVVQQLVLMIVEARTPDLSAKGRVEGPHCGLVGGGGNPSHHCSVEREECVRADQFCKSAAHLWSNGIPICVDILLYPACNHGKEAASVTEGAVAMATRENTLLVERWMVEMERRRPLQLLPPSLLLQAVRSHLHFSQISSWLYSHGGKLPGLLLVYRINPPGEESILDFPDLPDTHTFPVCTASRQQLKVRVNALNRLSGLPLLMCVGDDNDNDHHDEFMETKFFRGSYDNNDGGDFLSEDPNQEDACFGSHQLEDRKVFKSERGQGRSRREAAPCQKEFGVDVVQLHRDGPEERGAVFSIRRPNEADSFTSRVGVTRRPNDALLDNWSACDGYADGKDNVSGGRKAMDVGVESVSGIMDPAVAVVAMKGSRDSLMCRRQKKFQKSNKAVHCESGELGFRVDEVLDRNEREVVGVRSVTQNVSVKSRFDMNPNLLSNLQDIGFVACINRLKINDDGGGVECRLFRNDDDDDDDDVRNGKNLKWNSSNATTHVSRWEEFKNERKRKECVDRERNDRIGKGVKERTGGGVGADRDVLVRKDRKKKDQWKKDGEKDLRIEQMKLDMTLIRKCDESNGYINENRHIGGMNKIADEKTLVDDYCFQGRKLYKDNDYDKEEKNTRQGVNTVKNMKQKRQEEVDVAATIVHSVAKSGEYPHDLFDLSSQTTMDCMDMVKPDVDSRRRETTKKWTSLTTTNKMDNDDGDTVVKAIISESRSTPRNSRFQTTLTDEAEFIRKLSDRILKDEKKQGVVDKKLNPGSFKRNLSSDSNSSNLAHARKGCNLFTPSAPLSVDVSFSELDFDVDSDATPIASPNSNSNTLTRSSGTESLFKLMTEKRRMHAHSQDVGHDECVWCSKEREQENDRFGNLTSSVSNHTSHADCTHLNTVEENLPILEPKENRNDSFGSGLNSEDDLDESASSLSDELFPFCGSSENLSTVVSPSLKGGCGEGMLGRSETMNGLCVNGEGSGLSSCPVMKADTGKDRTMEKLKPHCVTAADNEYSSSPSSSPAHDPVANSGLTTSKTATATTNSRRMFQENLLPLASYDAQTDSFKKVEEAMKSSSSILHSPKVLFSCDIPEERDRRQMDAENARKYIDFEKVISESQFFKTRVQDVLGPNRFEMMGECAADLSSDVPVKKENNDDKMSQSVVVNDGHDCSSISMDPSSTQMTDEVWVENEETAQKTKGEILRKRNGRGNGLFQFSGDGGKSSAVSAYIMTGDRVGKQKKEICIEGENLQGDQTCNVFSESMTSVPLQEVVTNAGMSSHRVNRQLFYGTTPPPESRNEGDEDVVVTSSVVLTSTEATRTSATALTENFISLSTAPTKDLKIPPTSIIQSTNNVSSSSSSSAAAAAAALSSSSSLSLTSHQSLSSTQFQHHLPQPLSIPNASKSVYLPSESMVETDDESYQTLTPTTQLPQHSLKQKDVIISKVGSDISNDKIRYKTTQTVQQRGFADNGGASNIYELSKTQISKCALKSQRSGQNNAWASLILSSSQCNTAADMTCGTSAENIIPNTNSNSVLKRDRNPTSVAHSVNLNGFCSLEKNEKFQRHSIPSVENSDHNLTSEPYVLGNCAESASRCCRKASVKELGQSNKRVDVDDVTSNGSSVRSVLSTDFSPHHSQRNGNVREDEDAICDSKIMFETLSGDKSNGFIVNNGGNALESERCDENDVAASDQQTEGSHQHFDQLFEEENTFYPSNSKNSNCVEKTFPNDSDIQDFDHICNDITTGDKCVVSLDCDTKTLYYSSSCNSSRHYNSDNQHTGYMHNVNIHSSEKVNDIYSNPEEHVATSRGLDAKGTKITSQESSLKNSFQTSSSYSKQIHPYNCKSTHSNALGKSYDEKERINPDSSIFIRDDKITKDKAVVSSLLQNGNDYSFDKDCNNDEYDDKREDDDDVKDDEEVFFYLEGSLADSNDSSCDIRNGFKEDESFEKRRGKNSREQHTNRLIPSSSIDSINDGKFTPEKVLDFSATSSVSSSSFSSIDGGMPSCPHSSSAFYKSSSSTATSNTTTTSTTIPANLITASNASTKKSSASLSTTDDLNVQNTSSPPSDDLDSVKATSKRSRLSSFGNLNEGWDPTPPSRSVSSPNCMEGEVRGRGHQRSSGPRSSLLQQSLCNIAKESKDHRRSTISGASMVFNSRTSLPTQSSPAPLKRNPGGKFDYDSTLVGVKAIKNAFSCSKLSMGDKDREEEDDHKRTLSTSAPASTNCLLGNFEESILNGRIDPVGTVSGFTAEIGASGSFCPKHVHLPVSAFFFDLSDDKAPSPYLGHINLASLGSKKGYHIPKKGTVQVTLFNPNKTVVKMFVVMYDLTDMPPSSQTFIRQRTMYMPCDRNSTAPSYLRYLIHLRCYSSRSRKIYLHTDIRLIFARHKLDIDAKTVPYEMKSFTELPKNPKYSPKK